MEILIGHEENTLHHLEQAAKYAVLADALPEIAPYALRLLSGMEAILPETFSRQSGRMRSRHGKVDKYKDMFVQWV